MKTETIPHGTGIQSLCSQNVIDTFFMRCVWFFLVSRSVVFFLYFSGFHFFFGNPAHVKETARNRLYDWIEAQVADR